MPQFRIAIGYRTAHRHSEPVILGASYSPEDLQAAIDNAPATIERFEVGSFHFARRGRRRNLITTTAIDSADQPASPAIESQDEVPSVEEEQSSTDGHIGEDGPSLLPPAPRRRR